jgi:hypothetical protein
MRGEAVGWVVYLAGSESWGVGGVYEMMQMVQDGRLSKECRNLRPMAQIEVPHARIHCVCFVSDGTTGSV